ncbi:hypothetical protein F4604DRAFT_1568219, partial [Suillus subluteus]
LVYIHWFWPLQTFDDHLQTFHLTRSSHQHMPHAVVMPVTHVLQPCHLVLHFGREQAVDKAEKFYLNKYIDLDLFERMAS